MISLLFLNNFYPVTSSKENESDELLCTGTVTRYGPRNQLQEVKRLEINYEAWIMDHESIERCNVFQSPSQTWIITISLRHQLLANFINKFNNKFQMYKVNKFPNKLRK